MSVAFQEATMLPAFAMPRRKLWTRAEVERMEKSGLLEGERLELIEGELINKMGENRPHLNSVKLISMWLASVFGSEFVMQMQTIDVAPEDNPTSQPQPDVSVLKESFLMFRSENPRPQDLHLVVEVSATTLYFDIRDKARLYARAGIPEYWIANVQQRQLIVHREPQGGEYKSIRIYSESESVAPLAAPDRELRVADAFPR